MISVQTEDFNVEAEYAALRRRADDAGAIVPVSYTHLTLPTTPYV